MRTWMKLTVLSTLFVLTLGMGVAFAQIYPPTTPPTTPTTTTTTTTTPSTTTTTTFEAAAAGATAGASQGGLPRTGSSSSIPTAVVAAGMVAVGSLLVIGARRRTASRRT